MESPGHVYLVEILERWVQINRPNSLEYLLLDRYERELQSRPFKIGDHKPDLYLKDSRLEETIVGEAKTSKDLKTLHTYEQLEEFLSFVNYCKGLMLLSVELPDRRTAGALINKIIRKNRLCEIAYKVITPLDLK